MRREIEQICEWIKAQAAGFRGCVLGLSGGLDSAVVAALCARAGLKTHALLMPACSEKTARNFVHFAHAQQLVRELDLRACVRPIEGLLAAAARELFADARGLADADAAAFFARCEPLRYSNFCARFRSAMLYDFSAEFGLLVAGTSNRSERELGYFTLHGDDACAFAPIANFYKSEVFELARELKINEQIINKPPSADFFEGQSDEADLGASYAEIDEILRAYARGEFAAAEQTGLAKSADKSADASTTGGAKSADGLQPESARAENISHFRHPGAGDLAQKIIARVQKNRFKTQGFRAFERKKYE